jgi:hypothetical protein
MEGIAGETAIRQVVIECGKPERQPRMRGLGRSGMPRQQKAQFA